MVFGELTIFRPLRNINTTLGPVINHRLQSTRPRTPHKNFKKRVYAHALLQRLARSLHPLYALPGVHPNPAHPRHSRAARWI